METTNDDGKAEHAPTPGPRLLVPVTVEALLVGSRDLRGNWSLGEMNFANLSALPPADPEPEPFYDIPPDSLKGVTLHWALPDALTRGVEGEDGEIHYPCIPNRWLVLRSYPDAAQTPSLRAIQGWVVESDFNDAGLGTSSFPDPRSADGDAPPTQTKIGRAVPAEEWVEAATQPPFLHALGPGNTTFAAFYPNVRNVLGFHDDLSDLAAEAAAGAVELTYMVFGWYSDPLGDPLSDESKAKDASLWQGFVDECLWSAGGEPVGTPAQILCHGMVVFPTTAEAEGLSVPWSGTEGTSYIPATNPEMLVAVGNNAAEAVSALVAARLHGEGSAPPPTRHVERLLEAFQYGLTVKLGEVDGSEELSRQSHRAGFGGTPGGSRWKVTMKSEKPARPGTAPDAGTQTPPLTSDQREALIALNRTQRQYDTLERRLASLQRELYALWWKKIDYNNTLDPPPGADADYDTLIAAQESLIEGLQTRLGRTLGPALRAQNESLVASLGETMQLVEEEMQRFWRAADPVVLVSGAGRNYKYGEDGRFSDDGRLKCRWAGETISQMTIPSVATGGGEAPAVVNAADLRLAVPTAGPASAEIAALAAEAFFLDARNAPALASLPQVSRLGVTAEAVAAQQWVPWNAVVYPGQDLMPLHEPSGFGGTPPSKVGMALWSSPWSPLFLDWAVSWWPAYTDPTAALDGWDFKGYDYDFRGGSPPGSLSYKGRALLTPHVTRGLQTCLENFAQGDVRAEVETDLEDYLDVNPGGATSYQDLINAVVNWDVLSQSLSGLTEMLVQQRPAYLAKPYDPPNPDEQYAGDPDLAERVGEMYNHLPTNLVSSDGQPAPFNPVRAGYLQLTSLNLVDGFGHVVDVLDHSPPYQIRAGGLVPSASGADNPLYVYLPPRLAQHGRLLFRAVSAEDDTLDADGFPEVNPVCGWVLPNHLDGELAVFDAQGRALGQLITVKAQQPWVRWDPVPGTDAAPGAPPSLANTHLQRFVASLLRAGLDGGNALANLLQVIDSTLWTVNPPGESGNEHLPVLIGRPLAVVRAGLRLELEGNPFADLSWAQTGSAGPPPWTGLSVPVYLGNLDSRQDGLMGFCADADLQDGVYESFHALAAPPGGGGDAFIDTKNTVAVQPLWVGDDAALPPPQLITMLVEPRGGVTCRTGLLPADRLALPPGPVKEALAALTVYFRTGPVLSEAAAATRLPTPAGVNGTWDWVRRTGVTTWAGDTSVVKADDRARLADSPSRLDEGWLRLGGAVTNEQS